MAQKPPIYYYYYLLLITIHIISNDLGDGLLLISPMILLFLQHVAARSSPEVAISPANTGGFAWAMRISGSPKMECFRMVYYNTDRKSVVC